MEGLVIIWLVPRARVSNSVCIQINQNPQTLVLFPLTNQVLCSIQVTQSISGCNPPNTAHERSTDAKHVSHSDSFTRRIQRFQKNNTKWTKARRSKSCLVCSKPTFYSCTKIFIGRELIPDKQHRRVDLSFLSVSTCSPDGFTKTPPQLRGFKASAFHLISLLPYFAL